MRFLYKCIEGGAQPIVYKQKKEVCAVHDYIRICIRVNPISLAGFHLNICGFVYMRVMSRQLLCLYECIGREWGGAANRLQAEERGTYLSPLSIYILVICVYMRVLYACNSCFFLSVSGGGGGSLLPFRSFFGGCLCRQFLFLFKCMGGGGRAVHDYPYLYSGEPDICSGVQSI